MVLDGQCSCSGVNTVSGKVHFTKKRTSKKKKKEHQLSNGLFKKFPSYQRAFSSGEKNST